MDPGVETVQILRAAKAIIEHDHFVYVSGDHGSGWIDKDVIYPHTEQISRLAQLLAPIVADLKPDIICGPATGGLILSQWLGHHLKVQSVFAEHHTVKADKEHDPGLLGHFILRRNYDKLVKGKRVLVVDDIVNTGHSIRQTADAVRRNGGEPVAAAAICTRGNASGVEAIGVEDFRYLLEFKIPSWSAESCNLCKTGVAVNTHYAHGLEFIEQMQALHSAKS